MSKKQNNKEDIAKAPVFFGWLMILIFFGGFGTWASIAQIDSAAIAAGVVVPDSNRKTIQHLEGGIIEEIHIKNGNYVKAGQKLVTLSETNARAQVELLTRQYYVSKAEESRLFAERDGLKEIVFDQALTSQQANPIIAEIMDSQVRIHSSQSSGLSNQGKILNQRIRQLRDEINGLVAQRNSASSQLSLLRDEISTVQKLLSRGNAARPRLLALQRREKELYGTRGQLNASIAQTKQNITETELEILNIKQNRNSDVLDQLSTVQSTLSDLQERLKASRDVQDRLVITAPQSGYIQNVQVFTKGGVIRPGSDIMDIVPDTDKLVVECKVQPKDIDSIYKGLTAQVKILAYSSRNGPDLEGVVTSISADADLDEISRQKFYTAVVEVNKEQIEENELELSPGMPAEVYIITGERTVGAYLLTPILDSLDRSFKD